MTERQKAIFEAQGYLRNIARTQSDILMVYPDGIYGEETAKSVKSFQAKHGIEPTGEIDYETWEKIIQENEKALFQSSEPLQVVRITNEELPLKTGMDNELVYTLRLMLRKLSESFGNFKALDVSNTFDEQTRDRVLLFQEIISAEQTGEVDKRTWNELTEIYLLKEESV